MMFLLLSSLFSLHPRRYGTPTTSTVYPGSGGSGLLLRTGCTSSKSQATLLTPRNASNPSASMTADKTYLDIFLGKRS